ncbi:MAG TPA: ABC transporter ATP-binding protein [Bacteroidia bacterium]|nr:ABC transporter ATP-binding protein [Bacteroidia bacterium]HRS59032.1 ABC transporter ATP-binding protein [Bacteroidia bacterium]HRU68088.1 ABC transporter ATP-binding protein [Bacteroidia bacterium]
MNLLVQALDIHKSYGPLHVLKGISLHVQKAEIVAITGPSGAGKSTLLHILGSLDPPDSGKVYYNETDVFTLSPNKLSAFRNEHIGFVFQQHHLLPEFSAIENVSIPALIARKNRQHARKRALELLEFLGLANRIHHKPSELSGGELQRVAVARALINNPSIVLADEPSGNLDTANAEELHRLFLSLKKEFGQTFIIVTHNLDLAGMSDRIIRMADGKIIEG